VRTVLAVDGGNSKTDVALIDETGRLLGAVRGPTTSHQAVGLDAGMSRLDGLISEVVASASGPDGPRPDIGAFALAGADTMADVRSLRAALEAHRFADRVDLRNDTLGALRAGTDRGWGVVVICGSGVAAAGLSATGRFVRLAALGEYSGDWGGGHDVGWAGLAAAVRAADGRGEPTRLARDVPAWFGRRTPAAVTTGLYSGRLDQGRIGDLAPLVFDAAADGDHAARLIVDRLADEIIAMGGAMIRRAHLVRSDPDIVLAGGVFRTREAGFWERIEAGLTAVAPRATIVPLTTAPVAGAALAGLDLLAPDRDPAERARVGQAVRDALAAWDASSIGSAPPPASS